jgi:uncharacterized membrane protein
MNRLIALIFDDPYKAEEARAACHRMGGEGLLEIDETALIVKQKDGKLRTSQDTNVVAKDQQVGHIVGLVTAAITGTMPFILGATLGGRLIGRLTDHGITNRFIKEVGKEIQPGTSALILLGRSDPARRKQILERMQAFNPRVLESDLPPEVEQQLEAELQGRQTAA